MLRCAIWLLLVTLGGCTTTSMQPPPVEKPLPEAPQQASVPTAWRHSSTTEEAFPAPWWNLLNDPILDDLIVQSLINNPDIRIAEARLSTIRANIAEADANEKVTGDSILNAAENDAHAVQLEVSHAMTIAYADARLAEKRKELLLQRMHLARDLTARLNRKLQAGLTNSRTLREAEQSEIETRQAATRVHQDFLHATQRLALLSGVTPVEFTLPPSGQFFSHRLSVHPDAPNIVIKRRPDVQAAWQRLLAASSSETETDDDMPLTTQVEQTDSTQSVREALYRKSVLAALNEVETALADWRSANTVAKSSQDALDIQVGNLRDTERELASGRISQIELLKAQVLENIAIENALLAMHAQRIAFAAAQLALARD